MKEEEIARAAARQLAAEMPEGFPEIVEAEIAAPGRKPDRFLDPVTVSLAAVLVSAASLGWTIYKDLKAANKKPSQETLVRAIRVELALPDGVPVERRDRVVAAVAGEIVASDPS